MPDIQKLWWGAKDAAQKMVQDQNGLGHKGQTLFDQTLRREFVEMEPRVNKVPSDQKTREQIIDDLRVLVVKIKNFVWSGHFCVKCGYPLDRNHWNCDSCRLAIEKQKESTGRKVQKPGSASRRGSSRPKNKDVRPRDRKKGVGGKVAKKK